MFNDTIDNAVENEKCFEYMKPKQDEDIEMCA